MPIAKQTRCCRHTTAEGREQLILETAAGQRITLSEAGASVVIADSVGNSVEFDGGTVTVRAVGTVLLQAATVEIAASQVAIQAAMVQCTGVLQADTVIANTVAATTYTPGAGNVW